MREHSRASTDAVYDRVTIGRTRVPSSRSPTLEDGEFVQRIEFSLRDWLRHEDLFDYGVGPQFLARFDAVVLLNDLGVEALEQVFLEAPDSGYHQAKIYFESRNAQLSLSRRRSTPSRAKPPGRRDSAPGASRGLPPRDPRLRVRARSVRRREPCHPHRRTRGREDAEAMRTGWTTSPAPGCSRYHVAVGSSRR